MGNIYNTSKYLVTLTKEEFIKIISVQYSKYKNVKVADISNVKLNIPKAMLEIMTISLLCENEKHTLGDDDYFPLLNKYLSKYGVEVSYYNFQGNDIIFTSEPTNTAKEIKI